MLDLTTLPALRSVLIKSRQSLDVRAKRLVSNLIEQTRRVHDAEDLERLRPYMERQYKLLKEELAKP